MAVLVLVDEVVVFVMLHTLARGCDSTCEQEFR
jgi:hypothetical protein